MSPPSMRISGLWFDDEPTRSAIGWLAIPMGTDKAAFREWLLKM